MLFTLDYINNMTDFLPGIKIGASIHDDCDKDSYGLEQAVDFIKGMLGKHKLIIILSSKRLFFFEEK